MNISHNHIDYTLQVHLITPCDISMGWCKKDITLLLMHWSYVFPALTHLYSDTPVFLVNIGSINGILQDFTMSFIIWFHQRFFAN